MVTVLGNVIVMDIPTAITSDVSELKIQIFTKGQTNAPTTFTVKKTGQPWITIQSDKVYKDSTYLVQVGDHVTELLLSIYDVLCCRSSLCLITVHKENMDHFTDFSTLVGSSFREHAVITDMSQLNALHE